MRLFESIENMAAEIAQMERDEHPRREDRATVSDFYHGQPPYSQEEAEALGLQVNVNNLFGYEQLRTQTDQLLALYTTPARIWEIQLDVAPPSKKEAWEAKANQEWNRVMKNSGRLKGHYEFVAGDCTMHGEGLFWNPSLTDWCPQHCSLARRLIPSGASVDPSELTHFAILGQMTFSDLLKYRDKGGKGWNKANLGALTKHIFAAAESKGGEALTNDARSSIETTNVEMLTYHRQANAVLDRAWGYKVPVAYFFQVNYDEPTRPLDCTILSRAAIAGASDGTKKSGETVLFDRPGYYRTVGEAIQPLHMNSAIGGEPLWHRVKGLGHLNYSLSWHLEVLINRCIQAAHEQNTTFFQAADSASRESMEQILLKHNGIIPEGITMVQNRVGSDFRGLLSLIQLIREQTSTNGNSAQAGDAQGGQRPLEIQESFRQGMIGTNATNRVSHWFEYFNRLGREVWARFTNPLIQPQDKGYSEIMDFQAAMQRHGIPLASLQPANVRITTARVLGDGVRQKATAAAQSMLQNIALFGPAAQQDIKRMFAGVALDDYEQAERLVPYQDTPIHSQLLAAETENNVFAVQGKPMPVDDSDVDQIHLQSHFDFMGRLVQKGIQEQQAHFTAEQLSAFKAAGAHIVVHIRKIEPTDKAGATQYMNALNEISQMGQKLANNLQQQQQAQAQQAKGKPMSEAERASLQLEIQKLQLKAHQIDIGQQKFDRTQALREHVAAARQLIDLSRDTRDEHQTRQQMAIEDAQAAAGVAGGAAQPAGAQP